MKRVFNLKKTTNKKIRGFPFYAAVSGAILSLAYAIYLSISGAIFEFPPLALIAPLLLPLGFYFIFLRQDIVKDEKYIFALGCIYLIISDILLHAGSREDLSSPILLSLLFGLLIFKHSRRLLLLLGILPFLFEIGLFIHIHNDIKINLYSLFGMSLFLPATLGLIAFALSGKLKDMDIKKGISVQDRDIAKDNEADQNPNKTKFDQEQVKKDIQNIEHNYERVIKLLLGNLYEGLPLQSILFFSVNMDRSCSYLRAYHSRVQESIIPHAEIQIGTGVIGLVQKEKKMIVNGRLHHKGSQLKYYNNDCIIESILAVPVYEGGDGRRMVGILAIDDTVPDEFDPSIVRIIENTANVLGRMHSWVHSVINMEIDHENLVALYNLHEIGIDSHSINRFMSDFINLLMQKFESQDIAIFTAEDAEQRYIRMFYRTGVFETYPDKLKNSGVINWILKNEDIYFKTKIGEEDKGFLLIEGMEDIDCKSIIAAPIKPVEKDFGIGTIVIISSSPVHFRRKNAEFLKTLAYYFSLIFSSIHRAQQIQSLAFKDGLTGLMNHRSFQEQIRKICSEAKTKANARFSVIMIDLDHFKKINDTYGHPAGDIVLKGIAKILNTHNEKNKDFIPARYGGEEFIAILLNADLSKAIPYADCIRKEIEEAEFDITPSIDKHQSRKDDKSIIRITASFGVSSFPYSADKPSDLIQGKRYHTPVDESFKPSELIEHADKNLYIAKKEGRNRVIPRLKEKSNS